MDVQARDGKTLEMHSTSRGLRRAVVDTQRFEVQNEETHIAFKAKAEIYKEMRVGKEKINCSKLTEVKQVDI